MKIATLPALALLAIMTSSPVRAFGDSAEELLACQIDSKSKELKENRYYSTNFSGSRSVLDAFFCSSNP